MRLIHFSDNHLGAGTERREQDILGSFVEAIDRIIALKPDLVINSGDLFDSVRPANHTIAAASEQLLRLGHEARIPTVIISGNHDAPKQKSIGPVLDIFKNFDNIHVICHSRFEKIVIDNMAVCAVPHCLTDDILKAELQKAYPDNTARYNILVLHGVVRGIREFEMADIAEQAFDPDVFQRGYDYIALGHYHNFTRVDQMIYYSGSTERLSQAEAGRPKGFIEVDLDGPAETDRVSFHEIKVRDMVSLKALDTRGKSAEQIIEELEAAIQDQDPKDKIIRVSLSGISEETYRSLPFDRIAEMKKKAFSLDVRFEKEAKLEEDFYTDVNIGRLDQAFEKFLDSKKLKNEIKTDLKELAGEYLRRAETEED